MVISVHTNSILERTYVKIQVVCVQVLERPLQSHPGVILMRFPQFASKKYVPSRDSRVPYAFTDFLLIAWPCSAFCTWISSERVLFSVPYILDTRQLYSCFANRNVGAIYNAASMCRYPSFRANGTALRTSPGVDSHVPEQVLLMSSDCASSGIASTYQDRLRVLWRPCLV